MTPTHDSHTSSIDLLLPEHAKAFGELPPKQQLLLICQKKTDKDILLKSVTIEIAAQATALKKAAKATTTALRNEIESLGDRAEAIVKQHRAALMGKKKTLEIGGQCAAFRKRPVVEIDDETQALQELEEMMNDPEAEAADRISAQACLRSEGFTLNKEFMREAAKKCSAWLAGFGIRVVRKERLSINRVGTEEEEER